MSVNLTIDGKKIEAEEDSTILEAAQQAGIEIPTLCHNQELKPFGACRICLVELKDTGKLVASCSYPAQEGLTVETHNPRIRNYRKLNIELLLSNCPQDCLLCDRSGNCKLQDLAYQYQVDRNRFKGENYEVNQYTVDEGNPFIIRDYNKCILCGSCVRVCDEVQGRSVYSFSQRGFATKIATPFEIDLTETNCEFCGQCVAMCPTGALTGKNEKFQGREWEYKQVTTTCPFCGVGCQLDLNIRDGQVVKVTSNQEAAVNGIKLCVKGRFGMDFINSNDRLRSPLIKREGKFEEIGWEEALTIAANKLTQIKDRHGSDSLAVLSSAKCTNEENYLLQKFARAVLKTNNVDHCARLCHASTVAGLVRAFGSGAMTNSIHEIPHTDCILVTGSNTTETHPVISLFVKKAVKNGAKLIVVDPRKIELAQIADLHLQQNPGSDVAWLNAMMQVIWEEELYDKDFIQRRCEGFNNFIETIKDEKYSPQAVEQITGIPGSKIRDAARMYAHSDKATILFAMGLTQHSTGTDNVLSAANLAMLCGNVGRENTGVNPLRGQNNVQGACDLGALPNVYPGYQSVENSEIRAKFEKGWEVGLPSESGLTVVEMMNAAREGQVKGMYIMGENPMVSDPDIPHVQEALESLDFLIVQDLFMSETAKFADLILPAASFAEKEGTFTNTERRVQRVNKAIQPVGDSRPDWQIITQMAEKMGYQMEYAHPSEIMDELASLTPIYGGITHHRLGRTGLQWPCRDGNDPGTKYLHKGEFARGKGKFHPVEYKKPAELPDADYPLVLTTGRLLYHFHTRTMTGRVAGLEELVPEAFVEINPTDAENRGIKDGEKVKVKSRRGEIVIKAAVTEGISEGTVFIPFHFAEAAANMLTNPALDPIAKIPELKVCAVSIEPTKVDISKN